jgi:hypothetical protein
VADVIDVANTAGEAWTGKGCNACIFQRDGGESYHRLPPRRRDHEPRYRVVCYDDPCSVAGMGKKLFDGGNSSIVDILEALALREGHVMGALQPTLVLIGEALLYLVAR